MNDDTQLIYEAYLQESKAQVIAKMVICAAGLALPNTGCETMMDMGNIAAFGTTYEAMAENEKEIMRAKIEQQARIGTPEEGWEKWIADRMHPGVEFPAEEIPRESNDKDDEEDKKKKIKDDGGRPMSPLDEDKTK